MGGNFYTLEIINRDPKLISISTKQKEEALDELVEVLDLKYDLSKYKVIDWFGYTRCEKASASYVRDFIIEDTNTYDGSIFMLMWKLSDSNENELSFMIYDKNALKDEIYLNQDVDYRNYVISFVESNGCKFD